MSAVSARPSSRLHAARQRAEDAKTALAAGAVVLFSAALLVAFAHPGRQQSSTSVTHQVQSSDDSAQSNDLQGGLAAPATAQPQASTSLS